MGKSPYVLAFTGPSGSGKTTLVEKLIGRLAASGFKVGAIKRSHHKIDIDSEGKDSWRFSMAGANPTMVASDGFVGYMERTKERPGLESLAGQFRGKADIVLVEGFRNEPVPVFMFLTGGAAESPAPNVIGFISDTGKDGGGFGGRPVFHRDDAEGLAEWILRDMTGDG